LGIFAPFAGAAAVRNSASSSLAGPTEAVATHLPRALFRFEQLKRFATRCYGTRSPLKKIPARGRIIFFKISTPAGKLGKLTVPF
jgi:hypothetical protein